MDVQLYVYDLSKGLARQFSLILTGIQIDAIYHTSLVFGGVEYFFGQGIHRKRPGSTHHGQPMEILRMGQTDLPMEVIQEYLESLEEIYTTEAYDLFMHNCNNFTQDLCMFLLGKEIPEHIKTLPERFLNTPFGQMVKPQIDKALRGFTQGPEVSDFPSQRQNRPGFRRPSISNGVSAQTNGHLSNATPAKPSGVVLNVTKLLELDALLSQASKSCAVIFFTSATCPPCKTVYPAYDDLADEYAGKATLIKVDTQDGYEIARKCGIRATPTFITFLKGEKENEWMGANDAQLRGNVKFLVAMAFPPHPHTNLNLPSLRGPISQPVTYKKVPPLEKLVDKIGPAGKDPALTSIVNFVRTREKSGRAEASLPDLRAFSSFIKSNFSKIPEASHFALIDLARIAFADSRVSAFFVEEKDHAALRILLSHANDMETCSYNLRVVMLQLCCNLFTSPLYMSQLVSNPSLREPATQLATACLYDTHNVVRVLGASWIYNLAASNHNERIESRPDMLSESDQVELVAALLEATKSEMESVEALHGFLFALGLLIYQTPVEGEVWDLCKAMDVKDTVMEKKEIEGFKKEPFLKEVGEELLGKGLG